MDTNFSKSKSNEISVDEIMEKIRDNIRNKQLKSNTEYCQENLTEMCHNRPLQNDLSNLNSNHDIRNVSYFISSHRPSIGKILVKGRKVIHGEVRRYVDPVFFRQTEFNAGVVRILNQTTVTIQKMEKEILAQKTEIERLTQEIKNNQP